eukprot:7313507-Alexandrium_andersonii.AAC.1
MLDAYHANDTNTLWVLWTTALHEAFHRATAFFDSTCKRDRVVHGIPSFDVIRDGESWGIKCMHHDDGELT